MPDEHGLGLSAEEYTASFVAVVVSGGGSVDAKKACEVRAFCALCVFTGAKNAWKRNWALKDC